MKIISSFDVVIFLVSSTGLHSKLQVPIKPFNNNGRTKEDLEEKFDRYSK